MVQKIHDFRNAHTITFSWHHFLAATIVLIGELTIHALELHLLAYGATISLFAKDILKEIISKCEGMCDVKHED